MHYLVPTVWADAVATRASAPPRTSHAARASASRSSTSATSSSPHQMSSLLSSCYPSARLSKRSSI
jgi:hypothetical protein